MKSHAKKVLSVLLIAALLCTMFAGCSNGSGGASTTAANTQAASTTKAATTTVAAPQKEEPTEISYVSWSCGEYEAETWIEDYIEEKLNIELDVLKIDLSNAEAKNLMLASDEMPDCGWILEGASSMEDNGLIRTIPEDMIRTYAPKYSAALDQTPNGWTLNLNDAGEHLSLVGIIGGNTSASNGEMYRLDWLEAIGIMPEGELHEVMPGIYIGEVPFTNDQFLEIMEKFTTQDPDGNGEDDTYGANLAPSSAGWIFTLAIRERFGYPNAGYYYDANGVAQYNYAHENYREYVDTFAKLYQNGWIDPEWATNDWDTMVEKMNNGNSGYVGVAYGWSTASFAATRPPQSVVASTGGTVVLLPMPTYRTTGYSDASAGYPFYVNRKVDDEKLAKILEFVDFCHFAEDEETYMTIRFGEQGTHWEYSEPETKTAPVLLEGFTAGNTGSTIFSTGYVRPFDSHYTTRCVIAAQATLDEYRATFLKDYDTYPDLLDIYGVLDQEIIQQYNPSVSALVSEFFYDCMEGKKNAYDDWDAYIESLEKAGYDKMRDDLQNLPPFTQYLEEMAK